MLGALGMNCTRDRKREGEKWNSQLGGRNRKKWEKFGNLCSILQQK